MTSEVKYLGLHLDQRFTWQIKRQQLNLKIKTYFRLIRKNSQLSIENKLLLHKVFIKSIWKYDTKL